MDGPVQNGSVVGARVRYSEDYELMHVQGVGDALLMDGDHTFSSLDTIGPASLSSLRTAMLSVYPEYEPL